MRYISCWVVTLLAILTFNTAARAADAAPLHVYDEKPLSTCSSGYKKEIIDDARAHGGKAVHFTGQSWFISLHDEISLTPGKYRITVRARLEKGGRFVPGLEVAGREYFDRVLLDFGTIPADGTYVERSAEFYLPANIHVISLRDNLPEDLIVDDVIIAPVPDAGPVEVMAVQTGKLVYALKEAGTATVYLTNYAGKEQNAHLRLVIESGLHDEQTVRKQDIMLPAGTQMQKVTVPLPVLPEWGHTLRAEVVLDDKITSVARDIFAVSAHPQQVGQYGIFSGGDQYEAKSADGNVRNFRNTYATFAETCFWAPCEMSQLVPPPGKDRWWSGQTLSKVSTAQMRTYIEKCHAQGIAVLGYADFSNVFGYRIYDYGRRFPECLDWKAQNDDGFVWTGFDSKTMGLSSPQRSEADTLKDVSASGVARTLHTQPAAIKWHADQLVSAMQTLGFDGYRYDDNLEYDGKQVDILGRRAPFPGWSTDAIIAHFRWRIEAVRPDAILGHNSDPMRTNADAMYAKNQDNAPLIDALESAILRNGGFALQEGWSNDIINNRQNTWTLWRDRNVTAGRAAHRNGGDVAIITNMGGEAEPRVKRATLTALELASGNHLAYTSAGWRPYLALATRYSRLLYSKDLRWLSADDAAKTVQIDAGGRPVWWQEWVRVLPTAAGHRTYLVHLVNPPVGEKINSSTAPEPLQNVRVTFNLPIGWRATHAWLISGERDFTPAGAVFGETRVNDGKTEPYLDRRFSAEGQPSCEALPLAGHTVTVPEVHCWGMVAVECDGPAAEVLPSDVKPFTPAPVIPKIDAPVIAEKASDVELAYFTVPELRKQNQGIKLSPDGQAVVLENTLTAHVRKTYGLNWGWLRSIPTGIYRISVRCKAPRALTGDLTLTCATGANAPEQNKFPTFPPFTGTFTWKMSDVPTDHYGTLMTEMKWGEMPNDAVVTLACTAPGIQIHSLTVECLKVLDSERLLTWKDGWPAGTALQAHDGTKIWIGEGLFHDYYRLADVLKNLPGAKVDEGVYFKVGQTPCGFRVSAFPSPDTLPQYDMLVIADVDILPFSPSQLDQLRGWVEAGGRLIMTGGPYAFGRGEWHLSDLLSPMYPVEMNGSFDLQPVGVKAPVRLQPVSAVAKGVDWTHPPVLLWQHLMKAKPDAAVHVTAGGNPVIITRPYGKGKVCFITAAPLGDAPTGQTAFWDWPEWPKLLQEVVTDLMK